MMRNANRVITVMLLAAAFFFMGYELTQDSIAFAGEEDVLQVFYDDELLAGYSREDLEGIARSDGNGDFITYDFSAMNMFPSADTTTGVTGPKVRSIVEDALSRGAESGKSPGAEELNSKQMSNRLIYIKETGNATSFQAVFTVDQLFNYPRYYYPNAHKYENERHGAPALSESYEGAKPVPALFSLTESKHADREGRLLVGQLAPNEQNQPDWVQGVISSTSKPGRIIISSRDAERLNPVTMTDAESDGRVLFDKPISFFRDANTFSNSGGKRYWIYYTTDGSEPTRESNIYNYNNYDFGESYEGINKPSVSETEGRITLKLKVFGNGRLDSETTVFELQGVSQIAPPKVDPPMAPGSINVTGKTYSSVALKWTAVSEAVGYEIYRKTGSQTEYTLLKSFTGSNITSMTDRSLLTGTRYYYKVRAFADAGNGSRIYSPFTSSVGVTPYLTKPTLKKVSLKKKTATVKWKAVAGAGGYQIWRAEKKKTGKYKLVKTIKSGKTLSWKNKKLKKKKKYFYKIRAYRVIKGKKVFSSFSAVKNIKVK